MRKVFYTLIFVFILVGCSKKNNSSDSTNSVVKDNEGNTYNTVTIGRQVWMKQNLAVTHFNNGDPIQYITDTNISNGCYGNYNNSDSLVKIYGRLYTWDVVSDGRSITPKGFHIPSDAEWDTLATFLGGMDVAGGKMKEEGFVHWVNPNSFATNSCGFTGLPAGYGYTLPPYKVYYFDGLGLTAIWWSATVGNNGIDAWRNIQSSGYIFKDAHPYNNALSVRCIKD